MPVLNAFYYPQIPYNLDHLQGKLLVVVCITL